MKKTLLYVSAFIVGVSSLFVLFTGRVGAATATWDGGGGDNNMTTDANWVGDSAPGENDELVFPAGVSKKTVVNDFTAGTVFSSITFSGATASDEANYTISGNAFELTDGITADFTGNGGQPTISANLTLGDQALVVSEANYLTLSGTVDIGSENLIFDGAGYTVVSGVVSGSGSLIKDGSGWTSLSGANSSFTGAVSVGMGVLVAGHSSALGTNAGGTTVSDGARLLISLPEAQKTATVNEPITLNGTQYDNGSYLMGVLGVYASCGLSACPNSDITLSGTLTITKDVRIDAEATVRLTGTISGAHTIQLSNGEYGTLIINSNSNGSETANGTYEAPVVSIDYTDIQPSQDINLYKNMTGVVTGTYGHVYIGKLGTLKGTGTVASITMSDEGTLAPGLSPGILNSGNVSFEGGTHQVELGGTASGEYDQLNVTGTVTLGTETTLDVSFFNNYIPKVGSSYTIINNDGSDAVTGHFSGLAEGTTFKVNGYLFKITYAGGTGNDVVLSVQPIPTAPDTGFMSVQNPWVAVVLLCIVTPGLILAARRTAPITVR